MLLPRVHTPCLPAHGEDQSPLAHWWRSDLALEPPLAFARNMLHLIAKVGFLCLDREPQLGCIRMSMLYAGDGEPRERHAMSSQSGRALLTLVRARLLPDIILMGAFTATPLSQSPRPRGEAPRERRTPVVLLRFAVLLFRSARCVLEVYGFPLPNSLVKVG